MKKLNTRVPAALSMENLYEGGSHFHPPKPDTAFGACHETNRKVAPI
jgi:hypothetical protein